MSKAGVEKIEELTRSSDFITRPEIIIHNLKSEDIYEYCRKHNKTILEADEILVFCDNKDLEDENESNC